MPVGDGDKLKKFNNSSEEIKLEQRNYFSREMTVTFSSRGGVSEKRQKKNPACNPPKMLVRY